MRQRLDRLDVARRAEDVGCDHRGDAVAPPLRVNAVELERVRVALGEDGSQPVPRDRVRRGGEREARQDDRALRSERSEREHQPGGARRHRDDVSDSEARSSLGLELGHERTVGEHPASYEGRGAPSRARATARARGRTAHLRERQAAAEDGKLTHEAPDVSTVRKPPNATSPASTMMHASDAPIAHGGRGSRRRVRAAHRRPGRDNANTAPPRDQPRSTSWS